VWIRSLGRSHIAKVKSIGIIKGNVIGQIDQYYT
jgi:hypothetical protein